MRLLSLAVATPPERINNDIFFSGLAERTAADGMGGAERAELERRLRRLFDRAGTRERHLLYPPKPGYAADLLRQAATEALARAGRRAEEVELILYCAVARGWLEPSSAAGAQALIGARNASCFDVLEACAGWMRAVEVADSLLRAGRYRNALILGVEAGMQEMILPRGADAEVEEHHLAGFTLGEAATAMLVEADGAAPPEIVLRSDGGELQTCLMPLPGVAAFLPAGADPPPAGRLVSHAERLFTRVITELFRLVRPQLPRLRQEGVRLFIPHAASSRAGEVARRALGIPAEEWLCPHAEFGNTAAMSMPVALDQARRSGRLATGDKACFLVGSAGITYGYGVLTV